MIGGFRKSNKRGNMRKRIETTASDDDENEEGETAVDSPVATPQPRPPVTSPPTSISAPVSKPKTKKASSALSFGDEIEDADQFVLKRSTASENMREQVRREKKKKKKHRNEGGDEIEGEHNNSGSQQEEFLDVRGTNISNKPAKQRKSKKSPAVGQHFQIQTFGDDEEIEPDSSDISHRFSSQSRFGRPGDIPDAATIYAMKKKREKARHFSGQADYIPVAGNRYESRFPSSKSRLVREEMELNSSDDERMEMKGKQTHDPYLERRNQVAQALEEAEEMEEDEEIDNQDEEIQNWENEQIKKGSHFPAAVLDKYGPKLPVNLISTTQIGSPYHAGTYLDPAKVYTIPANDQQIISVEYITKRLSEQLDTKKQLHRIHSQELDKMKFDLESSKQNIETLEEKAALLEEKFSFFQDMRGFSKDLVECLNEKVEEIIILSIF